MDQIIFLYKRKKIINMQFYNTVSKYEVFQSNIYCKVDLSSTWKYIFLTSWTSQNHCT